MLFCLHQEVTPLPKDLIETLFLINWAYTHWKEVKKIKMIVVLIHFYSFLSIYYFCLITIIIKNKIKVIDETKRKDRIN